MKFNEMVKSIRNRAIRKTDHSKFEVGEWYMSYVVDEDDYYEYGFVHEANVKILSRTDSYITCEDEISGEVFKRKIGHTIADGEEVETFTIKELENAVFLSSYLTNP